jgi:hypothetical protein
MTTNSDLHLFVTLDKAPQMHVFIIDCFPTGNKSNYHCITIAAAPLPGLINIIYANGAERAHDAYTERTHIHKRTQHRLILN